MKHQGHEASTKITASYAFSPLAEPGLDCDPVELYRLAGPTSQGICVTEVTIERPSVDVKVTALVGGAHFTSHFFHLVLPPLFPAMHTALGLSYGELGLIMTIFFSSSALAQVGAGFVVDRIGPHLVLPAGMALLAAAIAGMGLATSYGSMLIIAAFGGIGNSVYHPADYSVLTGRVSPVRLARAYSIHTICGALGWAAAPITVLFLSEHFGWRGALMTVGIAGSAIAVIFIADRAKLMLPVIATKAAGVQRGRARFLTAPIVMAFAYFALLAVALGGLQNFLPTMLPKVQSVSVASATEILTGYLVANAIGSFAGGHVADMTPNHGRIVAAGLAAAAVLVLALAFAPMPAAVLFILGVIAGFLVGATIPSRDMLVRAATPAGSTGKVFGFVYSGLDLGTLVAPVVIGFLLDRGLDRMPFVFIAGALGLTIVSAVAVGAARRTDTTDAN